MATLARDLASGAALAAALLLGHPTAVSSARAAARSPVLPTAVERALTGGLAVLRAPASGMIRIARSRFVMGSSTDEVLQAIEGCSGEALAYRCNERTFSNEQPVSAVSLPAFFLDRNEVTVRDYDRCAERGACEPRNVNAARRFRAPELPVTLVSAADAETYCRTRGARLPTEREYERAARGTNGRRYPWGNLYNGKLANHGRLGLDASDASDGFAELAPVGSFPSGRTPDGFLNLAGNAAEWTADTYSERYDAPPTGERAIRGGHYLDGSAWLRGAARSRLDPNDRQPSVGFRCARSAASDPGGG